MTHWQPRRGYHTECAVKATYRMPMSELTCRNSQKRSHARMKCRIPRSKFSEDSPTGVQPRLGFGPYRLQGGREGKDGGQREGHREKRVGKGGREDGHQGRGNGARGVGG